MEKKILDSYFIEPIGRINNFNLFHKQKMVEVGVIIREKEGIHRIGRTISLFNITDFSIQNLTKLTKEELKSVALWEE